MVVAPASLSLYASEAKCQTINTEETYEFFRVWIACITYGLLIATIITVPIFMCLPSDSMRRDRYADLLKTESEKEGQRQEEEVDDDNVGGCGEGLVFFGAPLPNIGGSLYFELRVDETRKEDLEHTLEGGFAIGVTTALPKDSAKLFENAKAVPNSWSFGFNGLGVPSKKQLLPMKWKSQHLRVGDHIGLHVAEGIEVFLVQNGKHVEALPENVPSGSQLFPFVDLSGFVKAVSLVQDAMPPRITDNAAALGTADSQQTLAHGQGGTPSVQSFRFNKTLVSKFVAISQDGFSAKHVGNCSAVVVDASTASTSSGCGRGERSDDVKPPNFAEAQQHLLTTSCTDTNGKLWGVWSTNISDMAEIGGVGLQLYFLLLRNLGIVFMYMSIITAPITMFSWHGNFVPDTGSLLAKTTIGNMGWIAGAGLDQADRLVIIGCQGMDIKKLTSIFGYLDASSLGIYLAFVVYFRFVIVPRAVKAAREETITVADFSLEIDCLPREIERQAEYEDLLVKHIEDRVLQVRDDESKGCWFKRAKPAHSADAEVIEVTLVHDFGQRLGMVKDRAALKKKYNIEIFKKNEAKAWKLYDKIKDVDSKLTSSMKPEQELPVVRAYAILNTIQDTNGLLLHYRFGNYTLFRCCQSRANRFQGNALRIRRPPEPSNLLHENADVSWWERVIRQGIMLFCWMVLLVVAATIIFIVTAQANIEEGGGRAANSQLGSDACDGATHAKGYTCPYQTASLWNNSYGRTLNGDELNCFCTTRGYTKISQQEELYNDICRDWLLNAGRGIALGVMASTIVVILNVVFRFVINQFVRLERHLSVSAMESSKMIKIFGTQYVNTALIILFINWYSESFKIYLFGDGEYGDFERGWYSIVGGAMVTNMLLNTFLGSASLLGQFMLTKLRRCLKSSCACCCGTIKTQDELLEVYTNPSFDISLRFAQLLMTCFCTLTYNAGMPMLTLFASVYCFVCYWTDKFVLLRGSRRPPIYDAEMPHQASYALLLAAPIHAVFAIGMYSHRCTFPSNPLGGDLARVKSYSDYASQDLQSNGLFARATRESTWLLSLCLLIMIVLFATWVVLRIIGGTVGELWSLVKLIMCPAKAKVVDEASQEATMDAIAQKTSWPVAEEYLQRVCPPTSYAIKSHPGFAPYYKFMNLCASDLEEQIEGVSMQAQQTAMPEVLDSPQLAQKEHT